MQIKKKKLKLIKGLKKGSGRNNKGTLVNYTKGGGHKKRYRNLMRFFNFKKGIIVDYQYDSYRKSPISLVFTEKNEFVFIPTIANTEIGQEIGYKWSNFNNGDFSILENIPLNNKICFIYDSSNKNIGYSKAPGSFCLLVAKTSKYSLVRLKSGNLKIFLNNCICFIGKISSWDLRQKKIFKKAGRSRWLGKRPHVRGVAMNPVDHPHGGGEGKTSGGRPSVSSWGKLAKGYPTVNRSKILYKKHLLIQRYFG